MKKIFLFALALSFGYSVNAQQDKHFSQFYAIPTYVNPANVGLITGNLRIISNFRNQWGSVSVPYRTITTSVDGKLPSSSDNFWGYGLSFYNDVAGDVKMKTNNYNLQGAYHIQSDKGKYLSMGFNLGLFQRSVITSNLVWGSQWNNSLFDNTLPSNEVVQQDAFTTFDMGAGMNYYSFNDYGGKFNAGISIAHFNSPNVTFLGASEKMKMRITGNIGAVIPLSDYRMTIEPNALFMMQGPNMLVNVGTAFKFVLQEPSKHLNFNDEISISGGLYYRLQDAAYAAATFKYSGLQVGAAYDFNVSSLSPYSGYMGGMEFFISYVMSFSDHGGGSDFR